MEFEGKVTEGWRKKNNNKVKNQHICVTLRNLDDQSLLTCLCCDLKNNISKKVCGDSIN